MNLTGKELAAKGIITNFEEENVQMHSIDLNLIKVEYLYGNGYIPAKGKTKLVEYKECEVRSMRMGTPLEQGEMVEGWRLEEGTYNITFKQGCNIPNDQMLLIRQRSSLLRNGGILHSSIFDAGFKTENIGTIMIITHPIQIEFGARIATIYAHKSNEVLEGYKGQFQNDSQREQEKKWDLSK